MPTVIAILAGATAGTYAGAWVIFRLAQVKLRWPALVLFWLLLASILIQALATNLFPTHPVVTYLDTHTIILLGFYCIFGGGIGLILKKHPYFFFRPHSVPTSEQCE